MKQLSEVQTPMQEIATIAGQQSNTSPTPPLGSINTDGKSITALRSSQILTPRTAVLPDSEIQTMLTEGRSLRQKYYSETKVYKAVYCEGIYTGDEEITVPPSLSSGSGIGDKEKEWLETLVTHCNRHVVLEKMKDMMAYRPVYGGDESRATVIAGVARELEGISAYGLSEAFNHFAFHDEGKWFNAAAFCNYARKEDQVIRDFYHAVANYIPPSAQLERKTPEKAPPPPKYADLSPDKQLETDALLFTALGYGDSARCREFIEKFATHGYGGDKHIVAEVVQKINELYPLTPPPEEKADAQEGETPFDHSEVADALETSPTDEIFGKGVN